MTEMKFVDTGAAVKDIRRKIR